MRCTQCDYRLWNLYSRQCPECGTPFLPSDYEFVPGSVRFCCPRCGQSYYGTGAGGHLSPPAFTCVSCGAAVTMDEMVLRPTEGLEEEQTRVDVAPWLDREQRGTVRGWFAMIGRGMFAPGRLMASVPAGASVGQAWWYLCFSELLVRTAFMLSFVALMVLIAPPSAPPGVFLFCCAPIVGVVLAVALWGLAAHGILRIAGALPGGLGRTYQALCYSYGPSVLGALPLIGMHLWFGVSVPWWIVSAIVALRRAHNVSGLRAAVAVATPPGLILAGGIGLYVWFMVKVFSSASFAAAMSAAGQPATQAEVSTQIVFSAYSSYAIANGGAGPDHAVRLLDDTFLTAGSLIGPGSATREAAVPVGDTTLARYDSLIATRRQRAAEAAAAALPPGVVAHRLGDFVFTYHGIDVDDADPRLWLLVLSYDPDRNPPTPGAPRYQFAAQADGAMVAITPGSLAAALQQQNRLRAAAGLGPLPDPDTVTHAAPAGPTVPAGGPPGQPGPPGPAGPPDPPGQDGSAAGAERNEVP